MFHFVEVTEHIIIITLLLLLHYYYNIIIVIERIIIITLLLLLLTLWRDDAISLLHRTRYMFHNKTNGGGCTIS